MPKMEPRCPDCGVTMEEMTLQSSGGYNISFVSDENREGILGKLGMKQRFDGQTYVCLEFGSARL